MSVHATVGFLGAGQMAEALARGFVKKGVLTPAQVICTDPVAERRKVFESFGAKSFAYSKEVRNSSCDIFSVCCRLSKWPAVRDVWTFPP